MTGTAHRAPPKIVAVGGGKGGTGKSLLAANVGLFLATLGKRVTLVDAALGNPNLHVFVGGVRPEQTLSQLLAKDPVPISELAQPTPVPGLRLIAGVRDPLWVANPKTSQIKRLIASLRELDADWVLLDLGAGTASYTLDLFLAADVGLIVAVPEPTSVELCYRFLRAAFIRYLRKTGVSDASRHTPAELRSYMGGIPAPMDLYREAQRAAAEDTTDTAAADAANAAANAIEAAMLEFRPYIVINGARSKADMELGRAIAAASRRRLGLPISYLGHLEYDEAVWVAVRRRRPLLVEHPESRVSKCIEKVARRLLAARNPRPVEVGGGDSHYELFEVAPTASFEDIRRANRRAREVYSRESVVTSGLYTDEEIDAFHAQLEAAYAVLMDAAQRKAYDQALFPEGIPGAPVERVTSVVAGKPEVHSVERPPMPQLSDNTEYTGPLLQQIREASGVDLREISERTKIGMAYLQALEGEVFRKLPAVVYVRGFLVEYAKILGLDSQRLLDTYLERYRHARQKHELQ